MRLVSLSYSELVEKGVNSKFAAILSYPEVYDPDLKFHIGKTDWNYFIPEGVTDVVPLWDSNADSYVRWERDGMIEYVWLFHDDPNWALIAKSEQGIMAKLWREWSEFQDTDEECHRFADAIGFKHSQEALRIWESEKFDELKNWILELKD